MKGDFSRNTFDAQNHFSRVLMQQGRVQLDADWNEQASILLHYLQTLAADLIGPYGGPISDAGFALAVAAPNKDDLQISLGHYYVDGILCENEANCLYSAQPDFVLTSDEQKALNFSGDWLAYLDVWERHVTYLEDERIREVALGGPDTATRAQVVWQVKTLTDQAASEQATQQINRLNKLQQRLTTDLTNAIPQTKAEIQRRLFAMQRRLAILNKNWRSATSCVIVDGWSPVGEGYLYARLKPEAATPDPCITAPDSKYRGAENQLYRVEIHAATHDKDGYLTNFTFKWSRDNGSIVTRIVENRGKELVIRSARGFAADQWVELTDDQAELRGASGTFVKIVKVEGDTLTIDPGTASVSSTVTTVRRWDKFVDTTVTVDSTNKVTLSGTTDGWFDLEDGVQVQFEPDADYRVGDYWLIPARTTGMIEWPNTVDSKGNPVYVAQPPHGIWHHYAPLASQQDSVLTDCRYLFDLKT